MVSIPNETVLQGTMFMVWDLEKPFDLVWLHAINKYTYILSIFTTSVRLTALVPRNTNILEILQHINRTVQSSWKIILWLFIAITNKNYIHCHHQQELSSLPSPTRIIFIPITNKNYLHCHHQQELFSFLSPTRTIFIAMNNHASHTFCRGCGLYD